MSAFIAETVIFINNLPLMFFKNFVQVFCLIMCSFGVPKKT
jgi:hypothetical protein